MSNELLAMVMEELPDAFASGCGTAVDKMRAFVKFYQLQVKELQNAYAILPDSLHRPIAERITVLMERANREAEIAVRLRNRLEEISPGSSSDI